MKFITTIILSLLSLVSYSQNIEYTEEGSKLQYSTDGATFMGGVRYYNPFSLPESLPKTNLVGYWSYDYGINADSTIYLVDANNTPVDTIDIIGLDWDITNDSLGIPFKTAATLDWVGTPSIDTAFWNHSIYPTTVFQNVDYDSTTYFKLAEHRLNSDSTELYPARIKEIAIYSQASDAMAYFDVPDIAKDGVIWVASSGGDQTSIEAAISAASANDTIYVKSGIYKPATTITIDEVVTIISVGRSEIHPASGTYSVQFSANGVNFKGFTLTGGTATGLYLVTNTGQDISNCAITGYTGYAIFDRTINYISQCYINATGTVNTLNTQTSSVYKELKISGISTQNPIYVFAGGGTPNVKYYHCDFETTGTGSYNQPIRLRVEGTYLFAYCKLHGQSITNFNYSDAGIATQIKYKGCTFNPDTVTSSMIAFATSVNNGTLVIDNCTFYNHGQSNCVYANAFKYVGIYNSRFYNYQTGTGIVCYNGVDSVIVSGNYFETRKNAGSIIRTGDGLDEETYYALIEKNEIHGSGYFGVSNGTHGVFNCAVINQITRYNRIYGCNISVVYKGNGTINTSALIQGNITDGYLLSKGQKNVKFYNNTVKSSDYSIRIMNNNDVDPDDYPASGCDVKNNILSAALYPYYIEHAESKVDLVSDYNIFYNTEGADTISNVGVDNTLTQWQSEGFDIHSHDSNPNFTSATQLWPVTPFTGTDLGEDYNTGLDISTTWGSSTTLPNIVTKQQGATWQIGAYVK